MPQVVDPDMNSQIGGIESWLPDVIAEPSARDSTFGVSDP